MNSSTHRLLSIVFVSITLLGGIPLHAQTTTATTSDETEPTLIESIGDRAADFRDRLNVARQETIETRQTALTARTQERITNLAANISNRFDAIIDRLQNIATRLQSRIDKMKLENIDTSAAEQSLAAALTALEDARSQLATIDADVIAVVGSNEPRESWPAVKQSYLTARDSIRIAFQELKNVIINLKTATENPPVSEAPATTTDDIEPATN